MRILFLTSELPYPADSGGRIKTLSILEYLHARHDVALLCFRRHEMSSDEASWAQSFGKVTSIPLNLGRGPMNVARSYLARVPLSIWRNGSAAMANAVGDAMRTTAFDCVFVDHWLMAQYLPDGFRGLKLLHEHNAEYVMWARQAAIERRPFFRQLVELESRRVRRYEAVVLQRFDTIFAVSDADRHALVAIGADPSRSQVLPNLADPELLDRPALSFDQAAPEMLYFGTLSWQPNIEGLTYFMHSVLPLVREKMPEARLSIAGRDAPATLARLAATTDGVELLGLTSDAETLYLRARVFIETTRSGGGTKVKVLNALARGLPVVATTQAIEGLDVRPGEHVLTGDDAESLADAVVSVLRDPALWQGLSDSGRSLVRARYLAEVAYTPLDEALSRTRTTA